MVSNIVNRPVFVISLDTELAWGFILHAQHKGLALLQSDPEQGRETIDCLLKLFEKYNIPATWAIVGHLFLDSNEGKAIVHRNMPQFKEGWLDWDFYSSIHNLPLYCGKDIVEKILGSSTKHEIGLHGFLHIPFSQCSRAVAQAEIGLGIKAASKFGLTPKSFVFPQNKMGHIELLKEKGLQIYRGKNLGRWKENQIALIRKLNSVVENIIAPPVIALYKDGIWELPGSTHCESEIPFSFLPRVQIGLDRAILAKKVFHISLHPRSLLLYNSLKKDLERLLTLVAKKRDEDKLQVRTMGKLAVYLNQKKNQV